MKKVLLLLFLLLSAGSLFLTSSAFVNAEVAPKWYVSLFCSLVLVLAYVVGSLFLEKPVSLQKAPLLLCLTVLVFY